MKVVKLLILFVLPLSCLSQTKLDSLVLVEVNKYRVSNKLSSVDFSSVNFNASNHHSKYLVKKDRVGHIEDTLKNPVDRFTFFGGKSNHIGENVVSLNINVKDDSIDLEKISTEIVNKWVNSPEHNKILLTSDFKFAGVSCVYTSKSTGIKGWSNMNFISTLVLSN